MLQIEVLCFAAVRDAVGAARLHLVLPAGATVREAVAVLRADHPALAPALPSLRYAVDEEFVSTDAALRDGQTLALIPPVSGG